MCGIDSGYYLFRDQVYDVARQHPNIIATKGRGTMAKLYNMSLIDIMRNGRTIKNGLALWHVNTDYWKTWLHARFQQPPETPNSWLLPEDIDIDFCAQLVSEQRIMGKSGKVQWKATGANHYFDCEVINAMIAHMSQLHTLEIPQHEKPKIKKKSGWLGRTSGGWLR